MTVPHVGTPFSRNRFLRWLVLAGGLFSAALAVSPTSRMTWALENLLVLGAAVLLVATHRRFVFSNLSYTLIAVFLALHSVGSHYTYSEVPLGALVRDALGLARNPYDRFVHFTFGLLLAYPLRELLVRVAHVHRGWSYAIPVLAILALSSGYEILESWAARVVDPEVGIAFVGAQGDVWDGQKDMTLALVGAMLAMGIAALLRRRTGREPYLGLGGASGGPVGACGAGATREGQPKAAPREITI